MRTKGQWPHISTGWDIKHSWDSKKQVIGKYIQFDSISIYIFHILYEDAYRCDNTIKLIREWFALNSGALPMEGEWLGGTGCY